MALYEHVFLARQDVTAQQVEALTEQMKSIITAGGGKVTKVEYWGVKSLAFRIKKNRKAHMTLINIDAPSAAVAEMERQMNISEDVIRLLTLKMDELEEGPSAMLRKRDETEERGERFERPERGGERGARGPRPPRAPRPDYNPSEA
jgi:small subunit ribosomal protein S6